MPKNPKQKNLKPWEIKLRRSAFYCAVYFLGLISEMAFGDFSENSTSSYAVNIKNFPDLLGGVCGQQASQAQAGGVNVPTVTALLASYRSTYREYNLKFGPILAEIGAHPHDRQVHEQYLREVSTFDPQMAELLKIQFDLRYGTGAVDTKIAPSREGALVEKNIAKIIPPELFVLGDPNLIFLVEVGAFVGVRISPANFFKDRRILEQYFPESVSNLALTVDGTAGVPIRSLALDPIMRRMRTLRVTGFSVYAGTYREGQFSNLLLDPNSKISDLTLDPHVAKLDDELIGSGGTLSKIITSLHLRRQLGPVTIEGTLASSDREAPFPWFHRSPGGTIQSDWSTWMGRAKTSFPNLADLQIQQKGATSEEMQVATQAGAALGVRLNFYQ